MQIRIEPLHFGHDHQDFSCRNQGIDDHCKQGLESHEQHKTRVFVALDDQSDRIIGFYALMIKPIVKTKGEKYDGPSIHLTALGVLKDRQRQGIGEALVVDAMHKAYQVAYAVGAYCLWLQAVDQETATYYERFEFERFDGPKDLRMFIPIKKVIALVEGE